MATTTTKATPDSPIHEPGAVPAQQQAELQKRGYISGSNFPDVEASKSSSNLSPPRAGYVEAPDSKPLGKAKAEEVSQVKAFVAGGLGGVMSVLVGHPFDLTKVRLQTAAPGVYNGAIDVVKKTIARDGPRGLFKGMASPLVGVTPFYAVSFWGFNMGKKVVYSATPNRTSPDLSKLELAIAGGLSAIPTTAIACPMERVKVVLQSQGDNAMYKGPVDVVRKLYAEGGMRSLFRGTGATLMRDVPGSAVYFAAYEIAKKAVKPADREAGILSIIAAGGLAGVAMWSIAIPPDTVKSRLQSAPQGTYTGFMDCARKLMAQDGPKALFKGFGPAMARAIPANGAAFLGYELALKVMG